ncbi:hypothetical protein [uncultured Dokdonia sp.]|uniref:hypothetical protein n=1 Tax=uncultured Dokdonia sp. TaxID=575653 RepID=UPI0026325C96|nr:hypothetical protein [uncultured Dokdonia sp.]
MKKSKKVLELNKLVISKLNDLHSINGGSQNTDEETTCTGQGASDISPLCPRVSRPNGVCDTENDNTCNGRPGGTGTEIVSLGC